MFPAPFKLFFAVVPLLVAAGALAMAAFPRRMTRWNLRSADGSTQTLEPSDTRILLMRVAGLVVAGLALFMLYGVFTVIP